jgi:hypothetical protein
MLDHADFVHLVRGGELRVETDQGTACICLSDVGYHLMSRAVYDAEHDRRDRIGKIQTRKARP